MDGIIFRKKKDDRCRDTSTNQNDFYAKISRKIINNDENFNVIVNIHDYLQKNKQLFTIKSTSSN